MDGFCLQGELDLTLFYKIEGYFENPKSLMTENDRDLNVEGTKRSVYLRESPKMVEEPRIEIVR